jgi:integrase
MARGQSYLGFVQQRERDGAGPATILQDLSYVHTVLVGGGTLLDVDVAQAKAALGGVRRMLASQGRMSKPVERTRRPSEGELLTLFDYWRRNPTREIPMEDLTLFAVGTAMRLGEIVRVRWGDLDTDKRTLLIRDRKHPRQKKGNDQTVPLLAGPFRLNGQVVDPLAIIRRQQKRGDRIFPVNPASVSTAFTRAVAGAGIADLRFHDLRHDGTSRLFEAGYAIEQVALVSGHRDWNVLRRYTQLRAEDLHRDLPGGDGKVVPLHSGQ